MTKQESESPSHDRRGTITAALITAIGGVIAAIIGGIFLVRAASMQREAQATGTVFAAVVTKSNSTQVSFQSTLAAPTETALPTYTPYPTPTDIPLPSATPTPSLSLPFQDNFDNGLRPEWRVTHGEVIITNWRLGAAVDQVTIEIGDQSLSDFTVDLDYWLATIGNTEVIAVFNDKVRYVLDCCWSRWEVYKDNRWQEIANGNGGDVNGHLQIKVSGNKYTVFINSKEHLEITYGSPMAGPLGIMLSNKIAFIDNLQITRP